MNWYLEALRKYATFEGRARRKEYWLFFLFNLIFAAILSVVANTLEHMLGLSWALADPLVTLYDLALFIPSVAVAVRRMHDTDHRGWWLLVPLANLVLLCIDSQATENRYGASPKGGMAPGAV